MPKKANKTKQNRNQNHNRMQHEAEPAVVATTATRATAALHEAPTQSPYKFLALFFGIPATILAAALIFRIMGAN